MYLQHFICDKNLGGIITASCDFNDNHSYVVDFITSLGVIFVSCDSYFYHIQVIDFINYLGVISCTP